MISIPIVCGLNWVYSEKILSCNRRKEDSF